MSEHADFIRSTLEANGDASALTASWRRCLNVHGVDPDRATVPERDSEVWRDACERDGRMIAVASSYLDEAYRLLSDTPCGVLLADRSGVLLDLRTNRATDTWKRSPDAWLGTRYTERLLGTNGIGTCLAEERSVVLRGDQHLLTRYTDRVCVGAPIFGPDGMLAGCLAINQNLGACDARLDAFLSMTLTNFARRIEIEMFAAAFPKAKLMLASRTGTPACALLALDTDDCVIGATRAARRVLDLSEEACAGTIAVDVVLESQERGVGHALAEAERRTIGRALAHNGGNLSAAAKAMGISRSTLYRKMAVYEVPRWRQ